MRGTLLLTVLLPVTVSLRDSTAAGSVIWPRDSFIIVSNDTVTQASVTDYGYDMELISIPKTSTMRSSTTGFGPDLVSRTQVELPNSNFTTALGGLERVN